MAPKEPVMCKKCVSKLTHMNSTTFHSYKRAWGLSGLYRQIPWVQILLLNGWGTLSNLL